MKKRNLPIIFIILMMFAFISGGCVSKKHAPGSCGYHKQHTSKMWESAR